MGTFPTSPRSAFLEWCQAHITIFESKWQDIGITQAQAAEFKAATEDAGAKLTALNMAKDAARGATEAAGMTFSELRKVAAAVVRSIRTFAENTNDDGVYVIAGIEGPQPDQPAAPPNQPTDLRVALTPTTGTLELSWKCVNPPHTTGTSYIIRRRVPPATAFDFIGVTGEKKAVDTSFIAGPDTVQYTVQGYRSGIAGPVSSILTVNFGRPAGGGDVELNQFEGDRKAA